mmetsp:Transcript_33802/g.110367  ORF Transcript_33802/g.110367 Transcript_33802/m.110367 type:complete len:214 (-) Transcript_33802:228-869(-)
MRSESPACSTGVRDEARSRRWRVSSRLPERRCAAARPSLPSRLSHSPSTAQESAAPSASSLPPQGGFETTSDGACGGTYSEQHPCEKSISASTPAAAAERRASANAPGWTSFAMIGAGAASLLTALASATASSHASSHAAACLPPPHLTSGGGEARSKPGAVRVAMRAASTSSVPEPHIGSQRGEVPSYPACSSIAAARDSFIAALCTASPLR